MYEETEDPIILYQHCLLDDIIFFLKKFFGLKKKLYIYKIFQFRKDKNKKK